MLPGSRVVWGEWGEGGRGEGRWYSEMEGEGNITQYADWVTPW